MNKPKLLLFGGSFDPIHFGHINILKEAISFIKPVKTIIIPAFLSPLKVTETKTDPLLRLAMVKAGIRDVDIKNVCVSEYEILKHKSSYTINTVQYFQRRYHSFEIFFLLGEDSYLSFHKWYRYKEIIEITKLLVFRRNRGVFKINPLLKVPKEKILIMNNQVIEISSTIIRKNIASRENVQAYLPESVNSIIHKNRLYLNQEVD